MERPIASKTGRAFSKPSRLPEAKTTSVASAAWRPVPDNGVSSRSTPASARTSRAATLSASGKVPVSRQTRPCRSCSAISAAADARAAVVGREKITRSDNAAISSADLIGSPPLSAKAETLAGAMSKPSTSCSAAIRFRAIAEPITPSPMTPMGSVILESLQEQGRHDAVVSVHRHDLLTGGKAHPADGGDPQGACRLE